MKLEEDEDDSSPAAQRESETVSLDVASDSAQQRTDSMKRQREHDAERDAMSNHRYCAIVDFALLVVVLMGLHFSAHPSVVAAPIVTTNWCTTMGCEFNLVETSFNTGYLSIVMLIVFFLEDAICGFVIPTVYIRLARVHANYIGAVSSWICFSMLHMQAAILSGSVDPRTFIMYPLLMASFFLIEQMQAAARRWFPRLFCSLLVLVQWVLFITGESLQTGPSALILYLPFMVCLECLYFSAMMWLPEQAWHEKDRKTLMLSLVIRVQNTLWLALVLVMAESPPAP